MVNWPSNMAAVARSFSAQLNDVTADPASSGEHIHGGKEGHFQMD